MGPLTEGQTDIDIPKQDTSHMPRFAENIKPTLSNPAKILLAYMRLSNTWDSRVLAAQFDVPLRTIQRWKMECVACATDATGAISGVPSEHEHSATRATDATDGAPQAPDLALARDLQRAQANIESPTEISSPSRIQQQQQPRACANDVHDAVVAAAGEALNPISIGLHVVSDVIGWIQDGADLELDIVPTIQAVSRGKRHSVNSWRFYASAVAQAKAARLRGLPPAVAPGNVVTFRPQTDTAGRPLPSISEVLAKIAAGEVAHAAG